MFKLNQSHFHNLPEIAYRLDEAAERLDDHFSTTSVDDYPNSKAERAVDLTVGLVFALPVAIVTGPAMLAIKLVDQQAPVLTQERFSRGEFVKIHKLRTMWELKADTAEDKKDKVETPIFKDPNDSRITPVGKILRKTSIDEGPQIYDLLKGTLKAAGNRGMDAKRREQILCSASRIPELADIYKLATSIRKAAVFSIETYMGRGAIYTCEDNLLIAAYAAQEYHETNGVKTDFRIVAKNLIAMAKGTGAY